MRVLVTSIVDLERSAHNRLHRLLSAAPADTEITILSLHDRWKEAQAGKEAAKDLVEKDRWTIISFAPQFKSPRNQEIAAVATIPAILRKLKPETYDIHFNYNSLLAGWRVGRTLRRHHIPTVYDLADDLVAMVAESPFLPGWSRPVARATAARVVEANWRLADKVTVTTPRLAESLGIPGEKVVTIPNGVDLKPFRHVNRQAARMEFAFGNDELVLGYVGVLREWVDFGPLFEAVNLLDNPKIRIVIAGREGEPGRIERQATEAGLADRVRFLGAIPYAQVPVFTNAIDVGLLPFVQSGITENAVCLKIFEYTAAGRPVLATPLRPMVDIFGETLWYGVSPEELAAGLRNILADRVAATDRVDKAQAILPAYDWPVIGARFWRFLAKEAKHATA